MATPTAEEQLTLELINRLRMNPEGEYAELTDPAVLAQIQNALNYFGVDLDSFRAALAAIDPSAPLAWNSALALAASRHNDEMIAADTQSHRLPGELSLGARITDAGYTNWSRLGENIYAFSNSIEYGHAGFVIDWGFDDEDFDAGGTRFADWQTRGDGIQDPAGHLLNLVNPAFTEIGIAVTEETDNTTNVGPYLITHDLGTRWDYSAQFVGVVIDDIDSDDFYDIGEGLGGVTVTLVGTAGTFTTTTWGSGGWQIDVPSGTYDISFTGGALVGGIEVTATLGSANVKIDVEAADAVVSGSVQDGTAAGDTLNGSAGVDILNGFGGNDALFGFGGDDTLDGGTGDDDLHGGQGDDIYVLDSTGDTFTELSGEGFDTIRANFNLRLATSLFGEFERFEVFGNASKIAGNIQDNTLVANDNLISVLNGAGGNDTLIGGAMRDLFSGGSGNDTLTGGGGNDNLNGGTGADDMDGGTGNDTYFVDNAGDTITEFSGEGQDRVRAFVDYTLGANVEDLLLRGSATQGTGNALGNTIYGNFSVGSLINGLGGDDILVGGRQADTIMGGNGDDRIIGQAGGDMLFGGSGADNMRGGSGMDEMHGGADDDFMRGDADNDMLFGDGGTDRLFGDGGSDTIVGGADRDNLAGGTGGDVFVFNDGDMAGTTASTADRITDFNSLEGDVIDLTGLDAILGGGDDAFIFIDDAAFSGTAGELRWENIGSNTMVYMDTDGDGSADYAIRLDGTLNLSQADFIL